MTTQVCLVAKELPIPFTLLATIWRVPPQNKDWDEDLKALNGREAIPAEQESTPETNNIELTM